MQINHPGRGRKAPGARESLIRLPAVSRLLASPALAGPVRRLGKGLVTDLLRERLAELREAVKAGRLQGRELTRASSARALAAVVEAGARTLLTPRPRPVINATGIVVHTNLGRSLLSAEAAERVAQVCRGYMDLEADLSSGGRGQRMAHLEPLMARLFPGHGFLAVNNNAAAIMLGLRALSRGKQVLISRGELVEIGGSFRVPDILAASGAKLCEVGTTNRTRVGDYEAALTSRTGVILKVHTSNFRIVGFTEAPTIRSLARLARKTSVPLVVDWGSGDLLDLAPLGIHDELPVLDVLNAGADLVTFSGDKLLGGPQAGLIVGRRDLIAKVRKDPLARVCRLDRLMIAALHATLASYVRGRAFEEVPTLRMLKLTADEVGRRAKKVRARAAKVTGAAGSFKLIDGVSRTGGGSSPGGGRPTRLLAVSWPGGDAGVLERRLRAASPPVVARVQDGRLLLDLRTVLPEQDGQLADSLAAAYLAEAGAGS